MQCEPVPFQNLVGPHPFFFFVNKVLIKIILTFVLSQQNTETLIRCLFESAKKQKRLIHIIGLCLSDADI